MPPIDALLLISLAPIAYSCWIVLQAWLTGERAHRAGGEAAADADPAVAAALINSGAATVYWAWSIVGGAPVLPAQIPGDAWPFILGIGCFSTFIAILGFTEGTRRIGAAKAALLSTIEPIWTITFAAVLLGERLQAPQIVGGALILLGVILSQTERGAEAEFPGEFVPRIADE